jgi:predicted O-linked N-acetylglucosamine transferase (SPINDLY family)
VPHAVEPPVALPRECEHIGPASERGPQPDPPRGAGAAGRGAEPEGFDALYPLSRNRCDLDRIEGMGDPLALAEALPPARLFGLLRFLLSEAHDLETSRRLALLHRRWGEAVAAAAGHDPLPEPKARRPRGRLRIGLLSSDLRRHPVGTHLLPLLRRYDRGRLEIVAFSPTESPGDLVQAEIRDHVARFEVIGDVGPRQAAERIREAGIDILLELNGLTPGSRIDALGFRAAPVQIEWLGYQFTTGLAPVDHFLLDRRNAPSAAGLLRERILLMPESWVCFAGDAEPEPAPEPPLRRKGFVTFGTLAHPFKFTRRAFAAWANVLAAVPESRFLVVRPEAADPEFRDNVVRAFAHERIDPGRIAFFDNAGAGVGHLSCHDEIDIALDTLPVTGGTTTCEALWMGAPVVSLAGESLHQRLSLSLLSGLGLERLCAESVEGYVRIAAGLAEDADALAGLRAGLRARIGSSALGDGRRFARRFEAVMVEAARQAGLG